MTREILLVSAFLLGCNLPTEPVVTPVLEEINTKWGTVHISRGECEPVDFSKHIELAYDRASQALGEQANSLRLDNVTFIGNKNPKADGMEVYGMRSNPYTIIYRCSSPNAVTHELQHIFACDHLRNSGKCCTCQDHGRDAICSFGYDLKCRPTP